MDLSDFILKKSKERTIGIVGVNSGIRKALKLLRTLKIRNFVVFESKENRCWMVRSKTKLLSEASKEYFYVVATPDIVEIMSLFDSKGFSHIDDWIWLLEGTFYDGLFNHLDAPRVPLLTTDDLYEIERDIAQKTQVVKLKCFDNESFSEFEKKLGFESIYKKGLNKRYKRKILEYYFVYSELKLDKQQDSFVYIDVGACNSPFVKWLRKNTAIQAYAVDVEEGDFSYLDYYLCQDATDLGFQNESVDAISIQSAFEMFSGDADIRAIKEFARVLRKGGRVMILPLYMHKLFLSTVSPNYFGKGMADKDSLECIRTDCWSWVPLGRFYDVDALENRVLKTARDCGLLAKVLVLPNELVEVDDFVYLKFILVLEKT